MKQTLAAPMRGNIGKQKLGNTTQFEAMANKGSTSGQQSTQKTAMHGSNAQRYPKSSFAIKEVQWKHDHSDEPSAQVLDDAVTDF